MAKKKWVVLVDGVDFDPYEPSIFDRKKDAIYQRECMIEFEGIEPSRITIEVE